MKTRITILLAAVLTMSSCVTMFRGETGNPKLRTFNLSGNVEGATVYFNGDSIGTTPLRFTIDKLSKGDELIIKKTGYKDLYMWVERKVNIGWAVVAWTPCVLTLNPLGLGLGCLGTRKDYKRGSLYDLKQQEYVFEMEKK
jgi:hypothetical protein